MHKQVIVFLFFCCLSVVGLAVTSAPAQPKTSAHISAQANSHAHSTTSKQTASKQTVSKRHSSAKPTKTSKKTKTNSHPTKKAKSTTPTTVEAANPQVIAAALQDLNTAPAPTNAAHRLMQYVKQSIQNLTYTHYRYGGSRFDASKGVYQVDCSTYVDNVLRLADPMAFHTMATWSKAYKPMSGDYYSFFHSISDDKAGKDWTQIHQVDALRPGDIIVLRYKNSKSHHAVGHVMIVVGNPTLDYRSSDTYLVRIADSAPSAHSHDTRGKHSGVGIGTFRLKVNAQTGTPYAYAWKTEGNWDYNATFAMARLMG